MASLTVMILISIFRKRYLFNPVTIFSGIWLVNVFLVNFKLYDMIGYSQKTLLIVLLGNFGFLLGNIPNKPICFRFSKEKENTQHNQKKYDYSLNIPIVYSLICTSFICTIVLVIAVVRYLISGTAYSYIRDMLFGYGTEATLISSGSLMLFFLWIITGVVYAIIPIALIELFENRRNKRKIVFGGLFLAVLYTFATAGRATIFVLLVQIIILMQHYKVQIPKRILKLAKRIVVIMIVGLLIVSSFRVGAESQKHVNSMYSYFCISIPLLSHWIDYIDVNHLSTNGGTLLYGIEALLSWILQKFGVSIPGYNALDEMVNIPQNTWVCLFYDPITRYNAFCSVFYYFYLDFGMAGVFGLSLLFGIIVNNIFNKIKRDKKSLFYYLVIVQILVLSFIKLQTSNPPYIIAFCVLTIAVKRKMSLNKLEENI